MAHSRPARACERRVGLVNFQLEPSLEPTAYVPTRTPRRALAYIYRLRGAAVRSPLKRREFTIRLRPIVALSLRRQR